MAVGVTSAYLVYALCGAKSVAAFLANPLTKNLVIQFYSLGIGLPDFDLFRLTFWAFHVKLTSCTAPPQATLRGCRMAHAEKGVQGTNWLDFVTLLRIGFLIFYGSLFVPGFLTTHGSLYYHGFLDFFGSL